MITENTLRKFIEGLGHRPACASIDIKKILREYGQGKYEFEFYVNIHNLCWYVDKSWKDYNPTLPTFFVHIREIKLAELGI